MNNVKFFKNCVTFSLFHLNNFVLKVTKQNGKFGRVYARFVATTIQQYITALKIERIKELIIFGEETHMEIAYKLNYTSVAHLSSQFKKVTGLTPSHFKVLKEKRRITIQNI